MIVEKGQQQQQQLAVQQQQQRHLVSHPDNLITNSFNCHQTEEEEEEEDGDNDEENIVIDMADEDDEEDEDDNDDNHDIDDGDPRLRRNEEHESIIRRYHQHEQFGNHQNYDGNYLPASVYASNNNNNLEEDENNQVVSNKIHQEDEQSDDKFDEQRTFQAGELIWFDPNQYGYAIPGKVIDYYPDLNVLTVEGYTQLAPEAIHDGQYEFTSEADLERRNKLLLEADNELQLYELSDRQQLSSVKQRLPLTNLSGLDDLVDLEELTVETIIWNLKLRYKQEIVYTRCGHKILISVNPFKQLCNLYNLDQVNKHDTINPNKLSVLTECFTSSNGTHLIDPELPTNSSTSSLIRWLLLQDGEQSSRVSEKSEPKAREPHIFQVANEALKKLLISGQDQCFVLLGESGSGKTEACKLLAQYLATVNKAPTNLMTEQILESIQVLESFGNAKTVHNDNSSRFGKLIDVRINLSNGFILDAKTIDLNLLDRTRIVSQTENERNYHIFYELLAGLSGAEKEKYGLQTAEKYFYLNQGHCVDLGSKEDGEDFRSLLASMQVLGFNYEEQDTIFRLLASVLHLGNIYFHRKVLAVRSGKLAQQQQKLFNDQSSGGGIEGVEIGSDTEVRWVSHLLQIQFDLVMRCLTVRTTETTSTNPTNQAQLVVDRIVTPLNIDQALDTRDAIARALYTCLFKWLIKRINIMINGNHVDSSDRVTSEQQNGNSSRLGTFNSKHCEPVYLCRTSDSLCEFQPDKLSEVTNSLKRNKSGNSSFVSATSSQQANKQFNKQAAKHLQQKLTSASITILDAFGFENLNENNFEQLCINYAAELLQYHTNRYLVRLEQAEYAKERLRWTPVSQLLINNGTIGDRNSMTAATSCSGASGTGGSQHGNSAAAIVNLISKKPLGILALLDDECNFPKATDQSFAEKCHHNHTLNDNYQRARLAANCQEFGVRHFRQANRLVWYQVDGFIEKNRDVLRSDIVDLLLGSKMNIVADMLRKLHEAQDFASTSKTLSRTFDGRYVSMKPRATTVAARFQDALHNNRVLESINYSASAPAGGQQFAEQQAGLNWSTLTGSMKRSAEQQVIGGLQSGLRPNPWFVICVKPNRSRTAQVFDVAYVQDQARSFNLHEIVLMRKTGLPVRMRYGEFVRRYKCLVPQKFLNNLASCQDIKAANRRLNANQKAGRNQQQANQKAQSQTTGEIKRAIREVCSAIIEFKFSNQAPSNNNNNNNNNNSKNYSSNCETGSASIISEISSQYQCGLTKMFLNEKLHHQLESMRLAVHQNAIQVIQKTLRMWLIRRDFLIKQQAATVIQAQIRGFQARCEFWRQYVTIVGLQRRWRQQLVIKRRRAIEARRRAQRQQQLHQLQELQAMQKKQANQLRHRQVQPAAGKQQSSPHYAATRSGLDIPEDLAQLYRLQRNWAPVHELMHLNELNLRNLHQQEQRRQVRQQRNNQSVPFLASEQADDIKLFGASSGSKRQAKNQLLDGATDKQDLMKLVQDIELDERYLLHKFPPKYYTIESPQFGYSRLPITRPFSWRQMVRRRKEALQQVLVVATDERKPVVESQVHWRFNAAELKAVAIYKLILRYIDSDLSNNTSNRKSTANYDEQSSADMQRLIKFKLLADYVIYLCICEPLLRDEIYLQLASQSWQNPRDKSAENVWKLMLNCLSCFGPLDMELSKFLLRFALDYCCDRYQSLIVERLARIILANKRASKGNYGNYDSARKYPPSMLEYWANQEAIPQLALTTSCYMDDHALNGAHQDVEQEQEQVALEDVDLVNHTNRTVVQVRSLTRAEQVAAAVLRARKVPSGNLMGWSVEVQHEGAQSELSCRLRGDDKLLDHFARVELIPDFVSLIKAGEEAWLAVGSTTGSHQTRNASSPSLADCQKEVYKTMSDLQQDRQYAFSPQASDYQEDSSSGHYQAGRRVRKSSMSELQYPVSGLNRANMARMMSPKSNHYHQGLSHYSSEMGTRRPVHSSDVDLSQVNAGKLSRTSKLNRRYLHELASNQVGQEVLADYEQQQQQPHRIRNSYNEFLDAGNFEQPYGDYQSSRLSHRRSMSMQELQLAATSALNGRYFSPNQQQQPTLAGNHYAASYINQQLLGSSSNKQAGSLQQLATPVGYRRSRTPNSMNVSSHRHQQHRMSSSAYGSESRNSSAYLTGTVSSDQQASDYHNQVDERRARIRERSAMVNQHHQSGSLNRDGSHQFAPPMGAKRTARPHRSSSSSSRAPRSYLYNGNGSDYASAAYSDYERVGGGRYATPASAANYKVSQRALQRPTNNQLVNAEKRPIAKPSNQKQQQQQQQQQLQPRNPNDPYKRIRQPPVEFGRAMAAPANQQPGGQQITSHYMASSALSDTSEAPSLASHVRAVKVPQNNGDLDQYLDDLFNPMLDEAELDELSDARSLATSIRGTSEIEHFLDSKNLHDEELSHLCDATCLSKIIRGNDDEPKEDETQPTDLVPTSTREASVLSPTFESLLQSLNANQSEQLLGASEQPLLPVSDQREAPNEDGVMPLVSQLGGMNLTELKALNEKLEHEIQVAQMSNRLSLEESKIPAPPPQPNFGGAPLDDIYDRAKTVRIGKWRWPPSRDSANAADQEQLVDPATLITSYYESKERKARLSQQSDLSSSSVAAREQEVKEAQQDGSYHVVESVDDQPDLVEAEPGQLAADLATADQKKVQSQSSTTAGVGKLKISREMKAKLELLTTGSGSTSTGKDGVAPVVQQPQQQQQQQQVAIGLVSQARLCLQNPTASSVEDHSDQASRLNEQRRNLLESQLLGSSASSSQQVNRIAGGQEEPIASGGKVMAAKQQLAAAAGVALAALDGLSSSNASSQNPSRRQSGLINKSSSREDGKQEEGDHLEESGSKRENAAQTRQSRVLQDELGPQSKTAISQRQAFYQMSASSDQLDQLVAEGAAGGANANSGSNKGQQVEHGGSELHLAQSEPIPPPNAISSDNLQRDASLGVGQPLIRSMQMSSHLNEAGQSSALGQESDRIYGRSIAKSLAQRQHESLIKQAAGGRCSRLQQGDQQWVSSSSPDRTSKTGSVAGRSDPQKQKQKPPQGAASNGGRPKRSSTEPEQAAKRRTVNQAPGLVQSKRINNQAARYSVTSSNLSRSSRLMAGYKSEPFPVDDEHEQDQRCGDDEVAQLGLVYANVDWQVKLRKEFFLPSETYDDPLVVQLIFAQLVADVFNPRHWTRLNNKERAAMKALMKDNSIGYAPSLPKIGQMQQVKRDLIRMARSFGLYFTRSYKATNFALTCIENDEPECLRFDDRNQSMIRQKRKDEQRRRRRPSQQSGNSLSSSPENHSDPSDYDYDYDHDHAEATSGGDDGKLAFKLMQRLGNANNLGSHWIDLVAVHHSGLRLVAIASNQDGSQHQTQVNGKGGQTKVELEASANLNAANSTLSAPFNYKVLETLKYRDMTDVSQVGQRQLLVSMRNGKKCWLISSPEVTQLGSLLKCFHTDYNDHLSQSGNSAPATATTTAAAATTTSGIGNGGNNKKQLADCSQATTVTANNSPQRREKRANKDALLASDDDHHGDHIKQRQTADRINRLHPATNTNDDLANSERVLSNNLASPSGSLQPTSGGGSGSGKSNRQHKSPLSPATADGSRVAKIKRRPTGGSLESPPDQQQVPASENTNQRRNLSKSGTNGNTNNEHPKQEVNSSQNKKKTLWQNSLSRMSNKFSIFGSAHSRPASKQASVDLSPNNNNNNNNNSNHNNNNNDHDNDRGKLANRAKQPDESLVGQVALDAWIETKVDFDEDDDVATNNGASDCTSPGSVSGINRLTGLDQVNRDAERQDLERNTAKQKSSIDKVGDKDEQSLNSSVNETRQKKSSLSANSTNDLDQQTSKPSEADGRYSLLQFALYNFREAIDKYSLESRANKAAQAGGGSGDTSTLRGSLKLIETLRSSRGSSSNAPGSGGGGGSGSSNQHERGAGKERKGSRLLQQPADGQRLQPGNGDWTWRELAEMVKFTQIPIKQSLLKLPSEDLNKRAVDCFLAIMQYMGDYVQSSGNNNNNSKQQQQKQQPAQYQANEVECVYLILMNCHNFPILKDEIYCQLMKQTTNNRSAQPDSCLRGWRLFSIVAAYFDCSESFKPYLLKYLETAAYDKRRAYCSVAALCLQNLRKTFKYNGRKNVPSIEEIAATSAGRNSKRQIYRLPGGTERVINTKSTTVVDDIIHEICSNMLNVTDQDEMLEFSLYCIADGDLYTMPLNRDEYILDITTELIKNHQQYFLIFCRSIWHYPLRLDSKLYIEVIFNQIAPDYLEGLLLVLPSLRNGRKGVIDYKQPLRLKTKLVKEIARIAALLHRASGTDYMPHKDEVKYLLPKPIISAMKQHQRALIATEHLSAGSSAGSASSSTTSSSTTARNFPTNDDGPPGQVNPSSGAAALAADVATAASTTVASPQTPTSYPLDTVITTPQKWIELVQNNWREMSAFDTLDAKAQFLDIVRHWPLFGSSFFAIKFIQRDLIQPVDFILALNKPGIQMLDMATHETIHKYPFNEVISTRKVRSEDGALFLDLKCGNLMKRSIIRIQTDQAHEISRLIRQYIDIELLQQKQRQQQQQFSNQQVEITGNDYISNCEQESG